MHNRGVGGRLFGALLIVIAIGAVLVGTGTINFHPGIDLWEIILTVVLAFVALAGLLKGEWLEFFVPIAVFATVFNAEVVSWLHLQKLEIWLIWVAAILLSFGMESLFSRRGHHGKYFSADFSSTNSVFKAEEIANQTLKTTFGSLKVMIEDGTLPDNATLNLNAQFGGIKLSVPQGWQVIDDTNKSFAGVEIKGKNNTYGQTLTLTGNVSFGGVKVVRY